MRKESTLTIQEKCSVIAKCGRILVENAESDRIPLVLTEIDDTAIPDRTRTRRRCRIMDLIYTQLRIAYGFAAEATGRSRIYQLNRDTCVIRLVCTIYILYENVNVIILAPCSADTARQNEVGGTISTVELAVIQNAVIRRTKCSACDQIRRTRHVSNIVSGMRSFKRDSIPILSYGSLLNRNDHLRIKKSQFIFRFKRTVRATYRCREKDRIVIDV